MLRPQEIASGVGPAVTGTGEAPEGVTPPGAVSFATSQEPTRPAARASGWILAARLLLLLAAVSAVVAGFVLAGTREHAATASSELWVCPMDPGVQESTSGECPICHMALVHAEHGDRGRKSGAATHGVFAKVESRLFTGPVRGPAWVGRDASVTAMLYNDDLSRLVPGERGSFFRPAAPFLGLPVRLSAGTPSPWDKATSRVRFHLDAARVAAAPSALKAGDVGWLVLDPPPRELLVVPWSTVEYSSEGPYVLVYADNELGFQKRAVEIGRELFTRSSDGRLPPEKIVVLSGLREGERVVAGETFLSEAERRLAAAQDEAEGVTP